MKSCPAIKNMKLTRDFYTRGDVVTVAKDLLGKVLCTFIEGEFASGMITEVEAYAGRNDKACHANNGLRTKRTEVMYHQGGVAYVYLCYGIHHLFNVVTNVAEMADAVLIRAIEPLEGLDVMQKRRGKSKINKILTAGPGSLSQALGIHFRQHGGLDLLGDLVWIEDRGYKMENDGIVVAKRIGVAYAGDDAHKPWRFYNRNSQWVSKK